MSGPRNTPELAINTAIYEHWKAHYTPPPPSQNAPNIKAVDILAALRAAGFRVVLVEDDS